MRDKNHEISAILLCAGVSSRLGGGLPKQYRPLGGRALLSYPLKALLAHPLISRVQPVIGQDQEAFYGQAIRPLPANDKLLAPVLGGKSRQESVLAGLEALATVGGGQAVLIHDAGRVFLTAEVIDRLLSALNAHDGAIPALAVADSLKQAAQGMVADELPRDAVYAAQTPQAFDFGKILAAHRQLKNNNFTDDAALARRAGIKVALVEGDAQLFKVTNAQDFNRAEQFLAACLSDYRTGLGFDVHRFGEGDHVMLCGMKIPHHSGLVGHSDADVGLHAITDALLAAMSEGDIGDHFPPHDEKWRKAESHIFLSHAVELLQARGGSVAHIDVTLICEQPKIAPHRSAMVHRLAEIVGIESSRVSVKATTTEGLGFTGRGEGIAAQAVVSIRLPFAH